MCDERRAASGERRAILGERVSTKQIGGTQIYTFHFWRFVLFFAFGRRVRARRCRKADSYNTRNRETSAVVTLVA